MSDMTPVELRRLLRHVLDFEPHPNDVELAAIAARSSLRADVMAMKAMREPYPILRLVD